LENRSPRSLIASRRSSGSKSSGQTRSTSDGRDRACGQTSGRDGDNCNHILLKRPRETALRFVRDFLRQARSAAMRSRLR
jgi:hypothetical protein